PHARSAPPSTRRESRRRRRRLAPRRGRGPPRQAPARPSAWGPISYSVRTWGPASCGPYLSLGSEGSPGSFLPNGRGWPRGRRLRRGGGGAVAAAVAVVGGGRSAPPVGAPRSAARSRSPCWIARREITVPSAHPVPAAVSL